MSDDLDDLLGALARAPADRSLQGLENSVMRGVARTREDRRALRALAPLNMAMVGAALAIGLATGGFAGFAGLHGHSAAPALSGGLSLAPSNLLVAAR